MFLLDRTSLPSTAGQKEGTGQCLALVRVPLVSQGEWVSERGGRYRCCDQSVDSPLTPGPWLDHPVETLAHKWFSIGVVTVWDPMTPLVPYSSNTLTTRVMSSQKTRDVQQVLV